MPIDLLLDTIEADARAPRLPLAVRAGRIVEWAAIRIVTAFIIGMFVTVGMALAG